MLYLWVLGRCYLVIDWLKNRRIVYFIVAHSFWLVILTILENIYDRIVLFQLYLIFLYCLLITFVENLFSALFYLTLLFIMSCIECVSFVYFNHISKVSSFHFPFQLVIFVDISYKSFNIMFSGIFKLLLECVGSG